MRKALALVDAPSLVIQAKGDTGVFPSDAWSQLLVKSGQSFIAAVPSLESFYAAPGCSENRRERSTDLAVRPESQPRVG